MWEILELIKLEIWIFLIAMVPIVELRGAIPIGIGFGLNPILVFCTAVAGNMIPVIPLLLLLEPVSDWLAKNSGLLRRGRDWLFDRTRRQHTERMEKYGALGLFFFVAIPAPGTGAWTGCLIAFLFNIRFRYALAAILAGVTTAGVLMTIAATGTFLLATTLFSQGAFFVLFALLALIYIIAKLTGRRKADGRD